MQTNPISNPSPTRPYNLIQLPSPQLPQEISPEEASKQRWKILFLLCSTTFGAHFLQSVLLRAHDERKEALHMYAREFSEYLEWIMGYLYLTPIMAGFVISRFGINKTFRFLMLPVVLGSLLTLFSFKVRRSDMYEYGDSMIRGSVLGLWVAQIYMAIKWFKGKELSLAIGLLAFSKAFNLYIGTLLSPYVGRIGLLNLLSFGVLLCVLAGVAVIMMSKIDLAARQEEWALVEEDEAKLNKPVAIALLIAIICFKLGENERWRYLSFLLSSQSEAFYKIFAKGESLSFFVPIILFPLFGFLADRKGGRTAGAFLSFLLLFIGNMLFYRVIESVGSDLTMTLLAASLLFQVGYHLFEVSVWAIVGHFTPKKVLGVVLGITYSLAYFGPKFLIYLMPSPEKGGVLAFGFVLVVGIVLMLYAWVGLKKKEDFAGRAENQPPQAIMPVAEAN